MECYNTWPDQSQDDPHSLSHSDCNVRTGSVALRPYTACFLIALARRPSRVVRETKFGWACTSVLNTTLLTFSSLSPSETLDKSFPWTDRYSLIQHSLHMGSLKIPAKRSGLPYPSPVGGLCKNKSTAHEGGSSDARRGEARRGEAFIPNAHFYCVAFSPLALAFLFPLLDSLEYWFGTHCATIHHPSLSITSIINHVSSLDHQIT